MFDHVERQTRQVGRMTAIKSVDTGIPASLTLGEPRRLRRCTWTALVLVLVPSAVE